MDEIEQLKEVVSLIGAKAALQAAPEVIGRISAITIDSSYAVSCVFQYFSSDLMGISLPIGDILIIEEQEGEEDDSTESS